MSGRLVAAMMMMLSFISKPSISTSSWLSVCSRSSLAAAHAGAALAPDGVYLIDETRCTGALLGLIEQVAHPAGAHADEHLDEVRAGDGEEGHPGLAGHGARQQGLAGAGRAVQQDALGDACAQLLELLGVSRNSLISCSSSTARSRRRRP